MPLWSRCRDEEEQSAEPNETQTSELSRADRYGLRLCADGGSQPVVDIVFVHGLTGDRESTWTEKKTTVFWPGQWLPDTIPDARILAFGYDADVAHFWGQPSHNRVANHASNLVQELAMLRRRTKTVNRPIIFVAHSLGGLVCEDALLVSQMSAESHIRKVAEHTRAFAFIGTPHHGADLAKWGSALAGFTSLVKHANRKIVQVLEPDSETLARIQQDFHSTVRNRAKSGGNPIQITCFFEELEVRGVGFIVPSHSAILPGYTSISIHADHMGMTKFAASTSSGFRKISDQLWLWVDDLKDEDNETRATNASNASDPANLPPIPYQNSPWPQSGRQEYNTIGGNISGQNLVIGNHVSGNVRWEYLGDYQQPYSQPRNNR